MAHLRQVCHIVPDVSLNHDVKDNMCLIPSNYHTAPTAEELAALQQKGSCNRASSHEIKLKSAFNFFQQRNQTAMMI